MKKPFMIGLSVVKNEQDVIEIFLRHNARLLDLIVVLDNESTDDTRKIIAETSRDLGNIVFSDMKGFGYNQSERMTRLLYGCQSAFFADYIFFIDADEFISAPSRDKLEEIVSEIPSGEVGLMPWRTLVPKAANNYKAAHTCKNLNDFEFRNYESPQYYKAILCAKGGLCRSWRVGQGNHQIFCTSKGVVRETILERLPLVHLPVRSSPQIISKAINGTISCLELNKDARAGGSSYQWMKIYDQYVGSGVPCLSHSELRVEALNYAQSTSIDQADKRSRVPHPEFNYLGSGDSQLHACANPLISLAKSWEKSVIPDQPLPILTKLANSIQKKILELKPADLGDDADSSTIFNDRWHYENIYVDAPPFYYLAEKYSPESILDIGCGIGAYPLILSLNSKSPTIIGIDGLAENSVLLDGDSYFRVDLNHDESVNLIASKIKHVSIDLVSCLEVLEHLNNDQALRLVDLMCKSAGSMILFSAAGPGQPGHGHINCRPIEYWLDMFGELGWHPDLVESLSLRSMSHFSWFRRNLVLLKRSKDIISVPFIEDCGANHFSMISSKPFSWYSQKSGIAGNSFHNHCPPQSSGYADIA